MKIFLLIIAFVINVPICIAQHGTLDNSFGIGGKVITSIGGIRDEGYSLAIQSDGKKLVAGMSVSISTKSNFALVRYNVNGSLDSTFGTAGKVTTDFGAEEIAHSVAIQLDGKIVVAGSILNNSNYDFAIARYKNDGTLDSTFGTNGKVTTAIGTSTDQGFSVVIQSDNKIVVAGYSTGSPNKSYFALVRYNVNGSLDNSFGIGGKVNSTINGSYGFAYSMALQTDGKILVVGESWVANNSLITDFALLRYNTNGALDSTFGTNGAVILNIDSNESGNSIAIQNDGKIIVVGYSHKGNLSQPKITTIRLNYNGSLDNSFGTNGKVIVLALGTAYALGNSIAIQTDGKILVGGLTYNLTTMRDFVLIRYNINGSLDNTFGNGGIVTTDFGTGENDYGYCIGIEGNGSILIAGYTYTGTIRNFAIARYNSNISGIKESDNYRNWSIYPNPSYGIFSIQDEYLNFKTIKIYNVIGEEIYTFNNTGQFIIKVDISDFPQGIYFVNIYDGVKIITTKIAKK